MRPLQVGEWVRCRPPGYSPFVGMIYEIRDDGIYVVAEHGGARYRAQAEHCRRVERAWVEVD
jgi:hypothetical protein